MLQATSPSSFARPRAVANWLFFVAALILAIVVVGGITRLTESGLSITQWKPITGIIPPLTDAQWQAEFAHYREIPQYAALNQGMTLAGFKTIFFWEYIHRLLARVIGMAFALPLLWFALRRQIPSGYIWRLAALLALGGLQGALGWLMVRSGLSARTEVAPAWLAAHLLTALFTMAGIIWTALDLRALERDPSARPARLTMIGAIAGAALFIQLLYGALMAGLRAGHIYNQWPLMGDGLVPMGLTDLVPFWRNLVDNPVTVQFIHRTLAIVVALSALAIAFRLVRAGAVHRGGALAALVVLQFALGVLTLLHDVPIPLGVAHQAGAALLLAVSITAAHWCHQGAHHRLPR